MDATHFTSSVRNSADGQLAVHATVLESADPMSATPPEWVMLIPAGEFSGRDGRGPFRLSDPGSVITATSELQMPAGLPIDYDHATDFAAPNGHPAPAAGWIRELAARDGALWGRVDWTPHGAMAITSHEYRYISPVFQYTPEGEVTRLLRAGLTNNPNLYLTAVSARANGPFDRAEAAAGVADLTERAEDDAMETVLDELREILGLHDDASPTEALAAVRALLSGDDDDDSAIGDDESANAGDDDGVEADESAQDVEAEDDAIQAGRRAGRDRAGSVAHDPARYVTVAQFQKVLGELNRLRAQSAREHAARAVDDAIRAGKLIPAQRQWAISYCQADVNGFAAFVARQPAVFGAGSAAAAGDFAPRPAPRSGAGALSGAETAICAQLGLSAEDFLRRKRAGRGDFLRLNQGGE